MLHLTENARGPPLNIEHIVPEVQEFHQSVGIVNIRLNTVRHKHAHHVFPTIGRHSQRGHSGAVLAAGNADDRRFAAAGGHLLPHPCQQTGQLFLCVKFHTITLSEVLMPYCKTMGAFLQEFSPKRGRRAEALRPLIRIIFSRSP